MKIAPRHLKGETDSDLEWGKIECAHHHQRQHTMDVDDDSGTLRNQTRQIRGNQFEIELNLS